MVEIKVSEFGNKMNMHEASAMLAICLKKVSVARLKDLKKQLNREGYL